MSLRVVPATKQLCSPKGIIFRFVEEVASFEWGVLLASRTRSGQVEVVMDA